MADEPIDDPLASRVGKTIAGKYKLVRLLGAGGMGAVYEAENSWTQKRVALKLMLSDSAKNPDLSARFLREARAASKIEHPNVVQVLDMGQDADGSLFIVQEFLKGSDLRRLLDERQVLPAKEAVELIVPVMSALVAAHRHKIVHRDIKPENVFLVKSAGTVIPKVIDFGIAKMDEGPAGRLTKSGAPIGTPWYFSPEAAKGQRVDAQSDVWAVGIMLYEMLAGRCPWKGETYNALLFEIASAPVQRLDEAAPRVPKALADVVHHALERERDARYRTMAEFLGALLDCPLETPGWRKTLRGSHETAMAKLGDTDPDDAIGTEDTHDISAPPPSPITPPVATPPGVGPRTTLGQTAREVTTQATSGGRRRWQVLGGAVAIVAVGATAIGVMSTRGAGRTAMSSVTRVATSASVPSAVDAGEYVATVTVAPSSATIELDDENTGVNAIERHFPRDGRSHRLRASAPGYETFSLSFDAPPPERISLIPIATTTTTSGPATPVATRAARSGPTGGRAAQHVPAPAPAPNGQPGPPAPATLEVPPAPVGPNGAVRLNE